ncbi:hypothetical protein FSARC_10478 [Fusarium sarcochroum]|uniref:10TM putative phosphate transporter extracellular tail domain-containing protein n=1 Tax=Fusarium sarcochroum TaxID=1208366 RepID=A0A8H4X3E0_9HYPO|nr:hypothetical protein FSARC_10478 [Fusarium sarcochroum]
MLLLLLLTAFCQIRLNRKYINSSRFLPIMRLDTRTEASNGADCSFDRLADIDAKFAHPRKSKRLAERNNLMAKAFYGESPIETSDLPESLKAEMNLRAFQHKALAVRQPTVWIPHDNLAISEDEIRQTRELSEHIRISSRGAAIDGQANVIYGGNPPDIRPIDFVQF